MDDHKTKDNSQKLQKIHTQARKQFETIWATVREERKLAIEDRRFYTVSGAMWEGPLSEQFANKPKIEVNKILLSVTRIVNEWRNNRISVDFVSKDGSEGGQLADICDGLFRSDEKYSTAKEAYDNAFEEGVGGGMGAWRLIPEYEDEDDDENEHQRILIEPIYDADQSVFFDLGAKRQDKSDAQHCFVLMAFDRKTYEAEFGDDVSSWPIESDTKVYDWASQDVVMVAEYYVIEKVPHKVYYYRHVSGNEMRKTQDDFDADETLKHTLEAQGYELLSEKSVKKTRVHKYIMSGGKILKDCGLIAGSHIPIVIYYAKRWMIDGVERSMGHVRVAKDVQKLKNMTLSKLAETSALSSIAVPIVAPEQLTPEIADEWNNANVRNLSMLQLKPLLNDDGTVAVAGPTGYTKPPEIAPADAALMQIIDVDINDVLGNQQAGEELSPNISGKAVELVQNRLDMQTFIYMSNMAKSMQHSGMIWLSIAKEIYVEPDRKMKILNAQGEADTVKLGQKIFDKDGNVVAEGDLTRANYDVSVDVGPSSETKRGAMVKALSGMASIIEDPQTKHVITLQALMVMEGEGLDEIKDWIRKQLVKAGVFEPTEDDKKEAEEAAQQEQSGPNPQDEYLQAEAEKSLALAERAQADTDKIRAQMMEILSGIDRNDMQQAISVATELDNQQIQLQTAQQTQSASQGIPLGQ